MDEAGHEKKTFKIKVRVYSDGVVQSMTHDELEWTDFDSDGAGDAPYREFDIEVTATLPTCPCVAHVDVPDDPAIDSTVQPAVADAAS